MDKYVNECINNYGISSPQEKKTEFSNIKFFEEEKECDILKNDDLSSVFLMMKMKKMMNK